MGIEPILFCIAKNFVLDREQFCFALPKILFCIAKNFVLDRQQFCFALPTILFRIEEFRFALATVFL